MKTTRLTSIHFDVCFQLFGIQCVPKTAMLSFVWQDSSGQITPSALSLDT